MIKFALVLVLSCLVNPILSQSVGADYNQNRRSGGIRLATDYSRRTNTAKSNDKVVVGYYVPWGKVEPEAISYSKLTHINYGFGIVYKRDDPSKIFIDRYYDGNRIRKLKKLASQNGVKVLISIGGWTGSQTLSTVAASAELRAKFIENAMVFLRKNTKPEYETEPDGWDLDGIDIDWEYPGRMGSKCIVTSPKDSDNYLVLLKELRAKMDSEFSSANDRKLLTAAVRVQPFDGVDGQPMKDVSAFAQYFDFINIMAYDLMGSWSKTTGPNAPFNYDVAKGGEPFSYVQGIESWMQAGFPPSKLVAGLAFYGRSLLATVDMNADPTNQYVSKDPTTPKGDETDANEVNTYCNEGAVYSGVYKYKFIRKDCLVNSNTANYGYSRYWDDVTKTPWLFNNSTKRYISYDDPQSIKIKVEHAKLKGIRGVMFWDMSHDFNDELLDQCQLIRQTRRSGSVNPQLKVDFNYPDPPTRIFDTFDYTNANGSAEPNAKEDEVETYNKDDEQGSCEENALKCADPSNSSKVLKCQNNSWQQFLCNYNKICYQEDDRVTCR